MITSIRLGFATNSSSSHSVIFGGSDFSKFSKEKIVEKYKGCSGEADFGCQYDTHCDLCSIVNYAILLYYGSYFGYGAKDGIETYIDSLDVTPLFKDLLLEAAEDLADGYIDHQSVTDYYYGQDLTQEEKVWKFISEVSEIITDNDNR